MGISMVLSPHLLSEAEHGQDGHGTSPGFSLLEMMAVIDLIMLLAVFALRGSTA